MTGDAELENRSAICPYDLLPKGSEGMGNLETVEAIYDASAGGCSRGLGEIPDHLGGFIHQGAMRRGAVISQSPIRGLVPAAAG